jgi:predicted CoA-binding protein
MAGTVAVIGASNDRRKFGNRAVRAFVQQGYRVWPVNPHEQQIEGLPVVRSVREITEPIDLITVYVPPEIGFGLVDEIASAGAREVWFNPGSESDAILSRARERGLEPIVACSITGIGLSPYAL